jgi:hypothetical protein
LNREHLLTWKAQYCSPPHEDRLHCRIGKKYV